jgi:16S rRNA G527 N7-methylase RsmG
LREALRALELTGQVETARFEELRNEPRFDSAFDLVSARAIKLDARQIGLVSTFLKPGGLLGLFRSAEQEEIVDSVAPMEIHATFQLSPHGRSRLIVLQKFGDVSRGT